MNCVTLYLMLYNHQHYIVLDLGCDGQFNVKMSLVQSWRCSKPLVLLSKWTEFQTTSPLFCIQISHPTAMEFDQWTAMELDQCCFIIKVERVPHHFSTLVYARTNPDPDIPSDCYGSGSMFRRIAFIFYFFLPILA